MDMNEKMGKGSRMMIAIAALALIATYFVPIWNIFMIAPQYPEGLNMWIWLNKITGEVDIINGLNHYIGMKHISEEMFPEFSYMTYIVAAFIIFGLVIAKTGRWKLLSIYLILLILAGIAALVDYYKWGYDYGHNLDPSAPIQIPNFSYQPPIIGHKKLLNFDAYSYPAEGGWIIVAISTILLIVWLYEWRRLKRSSLTMKSK
jgi:copper chaperone NosL